MYTLVPSLKNSALIIIIIIIINISRDIIDSVFYCFCATIYDVIAFLICIIQNANISKKERIYSKKKMPLLFILKNLSN